MNGPSALGAPPASLPSGSLPGGSQTASAGRSSPFSGAPPGVSGGAPPGAPPGAPFQSALATHWARTATAEGHPSSQPRPGAGKTSRVPRAGRAREAHADGNAGANAETAPLATSPDRPDVDMATQSSGAAHLPAASLAGPASAAATTPASIGSSSDTGSGSGEATMSLALPDSSTRGGEATQSLAPPDGSTHAGPIAPTSVLANPTIGQSGASGSNAAEAAGAESTNTSIAGAGPDAAALTSEHALASVPSDGAPSAPAGDSASATTTPGSPMSVESNSPASAPDVSPSDAGAKLAATSTGPADAGSSTGPDPSPGASSPTGPTHSPAQTPGSDLPPTSNSANASVDGSLGSVSQASAPAPASLPESAAQPTSTPPAAPVGSARGFEQTSTATLQTAGGTATPNTASSTARPQTAGGGSPGSPSSVGAGGTGRISRIPGATAPGVSTPGQDATPTTLSLAPAGASGANAADRAAAGAPTPAQAAAAPRTLADPGLSAAISSGAEVSAGAETNLAASADSGTGALSVPGVPMQEMIDSIGATIELASRQGIARARIELQPEELGHISIRLSQTSEGLRARVTADTPAGAQALTQGRSELRQSLGSLGLSLLRLDIGSSGQPQTGEQDGRFTAKTDGSSAPGAAGTSEEGEALGDTREQRPAGRRPAGRNRGRAGVNTRKDQPL